MLFEDAVDGGFREEIAAFVSKSDSQLPRGELSQVKCPLDKGLPNILRHLIPYGVGHRLPVFQSLNAVGQVPVVPVVTRGLGNAQRHQRPFDP